ncbi:MAG: class I SAM-dependent DNA methyltransferase [Candidatus Hodarchaeota archaeon]
MSSIEKIQPEYFQDFCQIMIPKMESLIENQFIKGSPIQNMIHTTLEELSWNEWQNRLGQLAKPLSKIILSLLYDKMLITFKKMEKTRELSDFLENVSILLQSHQEGSTDLELAQQQFIGCIDTIWGFANKIVPKTPILDYNDFSLNKLLELVFLNWDGCQNTLELIQKINGDAEGDKQLILPYIFEIGIPEQKKQQQGQIFTPLQVIDFICKENITKKTARIIDPACGTGTFLLGALRVLNGTSEFRNNRIELIGIEKDPILADIAESAINYTLQCKSLHSIDWRILRGDFFNYNSETIGFSRKSSGNTTFIMNPPYTRHEILSSEYKEYLRDKIDIDLQEIWPKEFFPRNRISGRSSLYVYFLIHVTQFLKEGDNFGVIIPNSWLDVDYGQQLQRFILDHYQIESIINSRLKKLILTAEVNTAILKLKRKKIKSNKELHKDQNLVNLITIDNVLDLEALVKKEVFQLKDYSSRIRVISVIQSELYSISKWGMYFRAPIDYFKLMERLDKKLIRLDEVASVRRGFTSGANDFFYAGKPGMSNTFFLSSWDSGTGNLLLYLKDESVIKKFKSQGFQQREPMFIIEKEYWMHRATTPQMEFSWEISYYDSNGDYWIPNYLVKSPKELSNYEIQERDIKYIVILIPHESTFEKLHDGIIEYIIWGEKWVPSTGNRFDQRPTCRSRKNWYELPSKEYEFFNLLCLMTINERYPFFYNPRDFYFDARFYGIQFFNDTHRDNFIASYFLILNSIFTILQLEFLGRINLGEGALDIKVYEYLSLKIPCKELIMKIRPEKSIQDFSNILNKISFSILNEEPLIVKEITNNFLKKLFSISPDLLNMLYCEMKDIIQMRIEKAR